MGEMIKFRWRAATIAVWVSLAIASLNCATPLGRRRSFEPGLQLARERPLVLTGGPEGSLAGRAGIRYLDQLLAINGKSLGSFEELQAVLQNLKVGDTAEFTVRHAKNKKGSYGEPVTLSAVVSEADFHCTGNWLLYGYETWYGKKWWWVHSGLVAFGTMDWSQLTHTHGSETNIRGMMMFDVVPERYLRILAALSLAGSKIVPLGEDPYENPCWETAFRTSLQPAVLLGEDQGNFIVNLSVLNLMDVQFGEKGSAKNYFRESHFALWPIFDYWRVENGRTVSLTPFSGVSWDPQDRDFGILLGGFVGAGWEEGALYQVSLLPLFYWHDYVEWLPLLCLVEWEKGDRPRILGGVQQLIPGLRRE